MKIFATFLALLDYRHGLGVRNVSHSILKTKTRREYRPVLEVRTPLVGIFSAPPYILSRRSGVRPNMKVGRILERRGGGVLCTVTERSPDSQTINLMIEMIVESQHSVPRSPPLHGQLPAPSFLVTGYQDTEFR